jgi:hypothetical protein
MIAFLLSDVLFIIIIIHPIGQSAVHQYIYNADDVDAKNNAMLDDYYSIGYAVTAGHGKLVEN